MFLGGFREVWGGYLGETSGGAVGACLGVLGGMLRDIWICLGMVFRG